VRKRGGIPAWADMASDTSSSPARSAVPAPDVEALQLLAKFRKLDAALRMTRYAQALTEVDAVFSRARTATRDLPETERLKLRQRWEAEQFRAGRTAIVRATRRGIAAAVPCGVPRWV
jgi:hypothetical protein